MPSTEIFSCFLFLAVVSQVSSVDVLKYYTENLHRLSQSSNEPVANASPYGQIQYSIANVSTQYGSNTKFQARGMAHLYLFTERFIQLIGKDEAFPEGFLSISGSNTIRIADVDKQWPKLLQHYGLILIVVLVAVIFATVMPIIGLTFCCCRCVGRCGSRSQLSEKRYDPCRRHFYGALLVTITVLISFGVICAFSTNEVLEEGVTNLPVHVRAALTDTELYLNNTEKETQTLLVTNFKELEQTLSETLNASGKIVLDKLAAETKASVLTNLTSIVDGLELIKNDLFKINRLTDELHRKSSLLDVGLKDIREKLVRDIEMCRNELVCKDFKYRYNVNELAVETNFSQLPNVTASIQNLSDLSNAGIRKQVMSGIEEFRKIEKNVQTAINSGIPVIMGKIDETGLKLKKGSDQITDILENMKSVIHEHIKQPVSAGQQMISEFSPYRYYVCFAVSCTLLVVLVCLTFGLLCGCCGSRPNSGYNDDCCNKGAGSRYLMLGVCLMFLSSGILMAISLVYFVAGVGADKLMCQSLKNPHTSRTFYLMDQLTNVNRFYTDSLENDDTQVNLSSIISSCHKNLSLYKVLQLYRKVNISSYLADVKKYGIEVQIRDLVQDIKFDNDIQIISPDADNLLHTLANSKLNDINFPAYNNVVGDRITTINLMQLATAINETAAQLPPSKYSKVQASLMINALYLQTHQERQVGEMLNTIKELEVVARQLQEHLKFNNTSLKDAINYLLGEVLKAQTKLKTEGQEIVTKIANEFGREFSNHIEEYANKVSTKMQHEVGRCGPVSQAYNATVIAGCSRILLPFNGFWFSVGAVTLLFIPAIILSVILSNLYQKSDRYMEPTGEAEYLYDVYAGDRDNVPLASLPDKKNKKKGRRSTEEGFANSSHSNGNVGGGRCSSGNAERSRVRLHVVSSTGSTPVSSNSVPLNSSAPPITPQGVDLDNRFDDGGAKPRWEFSASSAPTAEYERPPPYYYPGPTPQGPISEWYTRRNVKRASRNNNRNKR